MPIHSSLKRSVLSLGVITLGLLPHFAAAQNTHAQVSDSPGGGAAQPGGLAAFAPWPVVNTKRSTDWPQVGNDAGRTRYATLKQINKRNVAGLQVAWTFHTLDAGNGSTIECTPIVVGGVMYLTTARLRVVALDAVTGKAIWTYDPKSSGVNRGVAYWTDGKVSRILVGLPEGRLLSLDARTGQLDEKFGKSGIVYLRDGYKRDLSGFVYGATSAPVIYQNLVIVPILVSEGQPGAPGDVRAFDVRTGHEVWRFHTVPQPHEFGNETWPGESWKDRTGVNAWSGYTVDTKNGIVFAATGSAASDFYGADRKGNNLFANCLLALDARTGQRLWHFQTVHHDLWDNDNPCPPVLCTVKGQEAVALPTKTGFIYVFERKTGKSCFPIIEKPAPASDVPGEEAATTQPMPLAPPSLISQTVTADDFTNRTPEAAAEIRERVQRDKLRFGQWRLPPSAEGTIAVPGYHGGATWSGAAYDPASGLLYVNTNNVPSLIKLNAAGGGNYNFDGYTWFRDKDGYPGIKPPWGNLTAVDLNRGTFAWRIPLGSYPELADKNTGTENFGGAIVTGGGIVFIGSTRDEKLHAFDSADGRLLGEWPLPAGGYACPSTYGVNGKQYVVIAAGGGGKIGTRSGDTYMAFALPPLPASRLGLFDQQNLTAWCAVPFDARKRGPEERAAMLQRLGFSHFAYDWRPEHIPTFDAEVSALRNRAIDLAAWWFPTDAHDPAARTILDVIQRHHIHPQLWVMGSGAPTKTPAEQQQRIEQEAERIRQIVELAAPYGCPVELYNHNGWFGQPANEVAIIERLKQSGITNVGMVYNFSHGHNDIADFPAIWKRIQPHVVAVNVTGMTPGGESNIVPPGQGDHEVAMLRVIQQSGWHGPIGLIAEQGGDAEVTLSNYQRGLAWVAAELQAPGSGGPRPQVSATLPATAAFVPGRFGKALDARAGGLLLPGQDAWRGAPITVEAWAKLHSAQGYNVIVASDTKASGQHWELCSQIGDGDFKVYLPGQGGDVRSGINICDNTWHHLAMVLEKERVRLYVDGRQVADKALPPITSPAVPGPLAIGRTVEDGIGCDGLIDDVCISRGIRPITAAPVAALSKDETTIALWPLDELPKS